MSFNFASRPTRALLAGVFALTTAASAFAVDSVDLQVQAPAKVLGTIRDSAERESFVLDLPANALVSVTCAAKGKLGTLPFLELVDSEGNVVTFADPKGRKASIKNFQVTTDGIYRVRVAGDGEKDGDYTLKIKVKTQTKWTSTGEVGAVSMETFRFSAPAEATVKLSLKPESGSSGFIPSLSSITGPGGYNQPLSGGGSANGVVVGQSGEYTVNFSDAGTGGTWVATAIVIPKKVGTSSVDISAKAFGGTFDSASQVFGRSIGAEGGFLDPGNLGLALDGTTLSVPGGALALPSVLTISQTSQFFTTPGNQPSGPAVKFSPDGIQFSANNPVTITIPFDPNLFTDPSAELTIYVKNDKTGEVEPVPKPYDFSGAPGTVSFPSAHFSSYMTTTNAPRALKGDWNLFRIAGIARPGFAGQVSAAAGVVNFSTSSQTTGFASGQLDGVGSRWSQSGGTGVPEATFEFFPVSADVTVQDDRTVFLDFLPSQENPRMFSRGFGNDCLISAGYAIDGQDDSVELLLLARATTARPSTTNVPGRYSFVVLSLGAEGDFSQAKLRGEVLRGTAVFATNGTVTLTPTSPSKRVEVGYPTGTAVVKSETQPLRGTWDTDFGDITITEGGDPDDPEAAEFTLRSAMNGNLLAGAIGDPFGVSSTAGLLLLFREGSDVAKSSDLAGSNPVALLAADFGSTQGSTTTIPIRASSQMLTHTGTTVTLSGDNEYSVSHDAAGMPVFGAITLGSQSYTYTVRSGGRFDTSNGGFGIIAPRGDLIIGGITDGLNFGMILEVPVLRPGEPVRTK